MHLSDLKDTCTYVCNMHSLLMHTGYTAISTANLNLSTIKHTFARFSFLSPGEKNFAFTFLFDSYFNNISRPFPSRKLYKFISFEVKNFQTRSLPIIAELSRKFPNTYEKVSSDLARIFPICPERVHIVDDVLFGFVSNCTTLKTYFIFLHFFFPPL